MPATIGFGLRAVSHYSPVTGTGMVGFIPSQLELLDSDVTQMDTPCCRPAG